MEQSYNPPVEAIPLEKRGHVTYHLAPEEIWNSQRQGTHYTPETYELDGFVHCTDSLDELMAVGNRYYQGDPRPYLALRIDCEKVAAPIVYEDRLLLFPHIYGLLDVRTVLAALPVRRNLTGEFIEI